MMITITFGGALVESVAQVARAEQALHYRLAPAHPVPVTAARLIADWIRRTGALLPYMVPVLFALMRGGVPWVVAGFLWLPLLALPAVCLGWAGTVLLIRTTGPDTTEFVAKSIYYLGLVGGQGWLLYAPQQAEHIVAWWIGGLAALWQIWHLLWVTALLLLLIILYLAHHASRYAASQPPRVDRLVRFEWTTLSALCQKEFLIVVRNPQSRAGLVVLPVVTFITMWLLWRNDPPTLAINLAFFGSALVAGGTVEPLSRYEARYLGALLLSPVRTGELLRAKMVVAMLPAIWFVLAAGAYLYGMAPPLQILVVGGTGSVSAYLYGYVMASERLRSLSHPGRMREHVRGALAFLAVMLNMLGAYRLLASDWTWYLLFLSTSLVPALFAVR